jgi:hypothetical protein
MCSLHNWSHLLKGTSILVLVYMDHANLRYYRDPYKIGPRVTRYLSECEQYNMLLEYKPGAMNWADELSCWDDHDTGENPINNDVTMWPNHYFCDKHTRIQVFDMDTIYDNLEDQCKWVQYTAQETLTWWATAHSLKSLDGTHWYHRTALVVMEDNSLRRGVTSLFHNSTIAGHPRIAKTLQLL